jgi:mono/diheme cytochrome c family protein
LDRAQYPLDLSENPWSDGAGVTGLARRAHGPWAIAVFAILAAGAIVGAAVTLIVPNPVISDGLAGRQPNIANGAYLAVVGDCTACHTTARGEPFAGGVPFPTPFGTVYSSNITPDRDTGIGSYSFTDFARAMRFGVAPHYKRLYPAMPYTAYAKVSDQDLQDLFAFMQHDVAPVRKATRVDGIVWPLSIRWPLAFWNIAFHDARRFVVDPARGSEWNRGAYLVQGLGHCGTCHTPRGIALQEKDVNGQTDLYLSGAPLDGSTAINLRSNAADGLGRWNASDIAELLRTGVNSHSAGAGPMADVIFHSTQYMTAEDLVAIVAYLKSLSLAPGEGSATSPASDSTIGAIVAGNEKSPGGLIFMDSCAACHRLAGSGEAFAFPSLTGNPSVLSRDPSSLIAVILGGGRRPATAGAPSDLAMPAFGWRYSDEEIAQLTTFVRTSWGNGAAPVAAAEVASIRRQLDLARD